MARDTPLSSRGMYYGRDPFNPWLILGQILLVQGWFYVCFGFTLLLSNHFFGVNVSLGQQMFSFREYTFSTFPGWIVISSFVVSSVFLTTLGIVIVIGRAKKCLDFAVTLYVMHMFLSTLLAGFPTSFTWWAVIVGTGIIVTFVAEAVCMRLELREIPIGSGSSAQVNADIEIGTELKAKDAQAY